MFDSIEKKQIGFPKLSENYWRDKKAETNNTKNIYIFDANIGVNIDASIQDINIFKNKNV